MAENEIQSYVICTSPRSGSTMLCKLLAATGVAGAPDSHFHQPSIEAWLKTYRLDHSAFATREEALTAIFAAAKRRGTGDTDVFGLRLQHDSLSFFLDQLQVLHPSRNSDRERFEAEFGTTLFVYLKRDDPLDQAISRLLAEQTGLWHRHADGTDLERTTPTRPPGYDFATLKRYRHQAVAQNAQWCQWFDDQAIAPLTIAYEHLAEHPNAVVSQILTRLGLGDARAASIENQTAKLANETNLAWRERFEKDAKAGRSSTLAEQATQHNAR